MPNQEEDYEVMRERIEKTNAKYLEGFYEYLTQEKNLSEKSASKHVHSIRFYGNDYVLNYEGKTLDNALYAIDGFLGSWFIRKCMWSSPAAIQQNITSFKKFYRWMMENGHIDPAHHSAFLVEIKEGKDEWLERCRKYNDPTFDIEEIFPW